MLSKNVVLKTFFLFTSNYLNFSFQVSVTALTVLEEVCDDKMYLESLVAAKSSLLSEAGQRALARLDGRGRILLTRFRCSRPSRATYQLVFRIPTF